jgi:hypothetical protein
MQAVVALVLVAAAGVAVVGVRETRGRTLTVTTTVVKTVTTVSAPTGDAGTIEWRGDFETADASQWVGASHTGGLQAKVDDGSRFKIITSPVRQGRYAAEWTVYPGDSDVFGSQSWERAELSLPQKESDGYEGDEVWYAYSVYYPSSTPHSGGGLQFHPTGTGGPGQVGMKTYWPQLQWVVFGHPKADGGYLDPKSPTRQVTLTVVPTLQIDRWYDVVLHVRWSKNAKVGFTETFVDGVRATPLVHSSTLFGVNDGVYLKFGIYRAPQPFRESIIADGFRRATSYAAVVADFPAGEWPAAVP